MNSLCRIAVLVAFRIMLGAGDLQAQTTDKSFFNGKDLAGWNSPESESHYWSVEEGEIVGRSKKRIPRNVFLWTDRKYGDFHLSLDVKLVPNRCNSGIQFRSRRANERTSQAIGYQADIGRGVWARLYHEHGRGPLDWRDRGEKAVKPDEWNRYEILAVGDRIWTAVNGRLAVSIRDPKGEREGYIALQMHSGPPQEIRFRHLKLVEKPKVSLAGLDERGLEKELLPAPVKK